MDNSEITEEESGAWTEWRRRWREPITLFTLFLVGVGVLQWITLEKTDETLKLQQRAWLTPIAATLTTSPEKDSGISFAVLFTNSGREPATAVKVRIKNSTIDSYDARFADMADIEVPKNDTCEGLQPDPGRSVVSPTVAGVGVGITENSIHGEPRFVSDDRIVNGSKYYVVRGCAAYLTQGKPRYSSFCYILYSEIQNSPVSQQLQVGQPLVMGPIQVTVTPQQTSPQSAQSPSAPLRTYMFQGCAAGFDAT